MSAYIFVTVQLRKTTNKALNPHSKVRGISNYIVCVVVAIRVSHDTNNGLRV